MAQVSGHVEATTSALVKQRDISKCTFYMLPIMNVTKEQKVYLLSAPSGHCLVMSVACTVKEEGCCMFSPSTKSFLVAVDISMIGEL